MRRTPRGSEAARGATLHAAHDSGNRGNVSEAGNARTRRRAPGGCQSFALHDGFFFETALGTGVSLHHPAELPMWSAAGHPPAELEASRATLALGIGVALQLALQRGVLGQELVELQLHFCQLEQEIRDELLELRVPAPLADNSQAGCESYGTRNPRKQIAHETSIRRM